MSENDFTEHCEICEESVESVETTADGCDYCEDCAVSLVTCADCDRSVRFDSDMAGRVNGEQICEDCAAKLAQCYHCGAYTESYDLTRTQDWDDVCDGCLYDNYSSCEHCGGWYRDYDYCENECGRGSYGGLVNDYGYKPSPRFLGGDTRKGRVHMGFELEIDYANYQCAEYVDETASAIVYLKEDCSLSDGFEMVTHPMTHQYAREVFPWHMLDGLAARGADAGTAGLHVHVNRSAFDGPAHIYRWLRLVYRNQNAMTALSRRDGYALSEWAAFDLYNTRAAKEHAKGSRGGRRHAAVNVTNSATFEVRLFASSLNRDDVMAALDFVDASVEYTRHLTTAVVFAGGWTWSAFREWVAARPEYSALASQISRIDCEESAPPPARHFVRKPSAAKPGMRMCGCGCSAQFPVTTAPYDASAYASEVL